MCIENGLYIMCKINVRWRKTRGVLVIEICAGFIDKKVKVRTERMHRREGRIETGW